MAVDLTGKRILFGISGGIAAVKAAGWVSGLRREKAEVRVVMTEAATRFVAPLTLAALSAHQVCTGMFDSLSAEQIPHISLARECDLILVAPATAQTLAKLAHGLASDLLSTIILASSVPVILFPSMNSAMYTHAATQANLSRLRDYSYHIMEPATGLLACGEDGPGRLPEWEEARESLLTVLTPQDLAGQRMVITAGPTREIIDPVRYLSNPSTGKMGYALARTAKRRGAEVILITGPVSLQPPAGVEVIQVSSALQMHEAVLAHCRGVSVVVMAAAVSDFRPDQASEHKIKKSEAALTVKLVRNPDILLDLGAGKKAGKASAPLLVGFAAESRDHLAEGRRKVKEKNIDLLVVNDISGPDSGFAADTNRVFLLDPNGGRENLPLLSKEEVAGRIWDRVSSLLNAA
jgi:phosphopantothenoylcysteine decarboxylase/phosphopantothenate--cysteine ligase